MKKILTCLLAVTFSTGLLQAQSARYQEAMKKNIAALDSARTGDAWQQLANSFERIGTAEKSEWLPYYYAAYALMMKNYGEQDVNKVDPILDKADEMIAMAESLQPNHSDISTVKAMIMLARIRVDMSRGMTMAPRATELLQKAMRQEPQNNPRAMMMLAQNVYNTPEAFGGSKQKGIELLRQSVDMFGKFQPASEIAPNWGKVFAERTLSSWEKQ